MAIENAGFDLGIIYMLVSWYLLPYAYKIHRIGLVNLFLPIDLTISAHSLGTKTLIFSCKQYLELTFECFGIGWSHYVRPIDRVFGGWSH